MQNARSIALRCVVRTVSDHDLLAREVHGDGAAWLLWATILGGLFLWQRPTRLPAARGAAGCRWPAV